MTDRPTPETEVQNMLYHNGGCWVDVSFAKQLERQRDGARELARELRDALHFTLYGSTAKDQTPEIKKAYQSLAKAKEAGL